MKYDLLLSCLVQVLTYTLISSQNIVQRELCLVSTEENCLRVVEGVLQVAPREEVAFLWDFDTDQVTTICDSADTNVCITVDPENENSISLSAAGTEFTVQQFEQNEVQAFQFQVSSSSNCLNDDIVIAECVDIEGDILRSVVANQLFLALEEGSNFPQLESEDNGDDDDGRGNRNIGVRVFQGALFVGLVAVISAFVYKYDMIPDRLKFSLPSRNKAKVTDDQLAAVEADVQRLQEQNRQGRINTQEL